LGVKIPQKRIDIQISGAEFTIQLIFPSLHSTVSWNSPTSGDLADLWILSLTEMGLNISSIAEQSRLVTLYFDSNDTVIAKWFEDITKDPGVDKSYLSLACEYYGKLLSGLDISSSGFSFSKESLTITDKTCKYIPSNSSQLIFSIYGILLILFCHYSIN